MAKTKEFKTEIQQLLNLMINSLYSNRDIFLRELVANAADAIDKARFESLTNSELVRDWKIAISVDKDKKVLTISDNGIGMNEAEVIENIGSIAHSGTKAFMKALAEKNEQSTDNPDLIGQFGVGFYSAFMVASKVDIDTKKSGTEDPAVFWTSAGEGKYTIDKSERSEPGTTITLHLKDDCQVYLDNWKIEDIIRKYSDFIAYPITLPEKKVNEDKTETIEEKTLNSQKAIWLRKPSEISEDEYKSFYSHVASAGGTHLKAIHINAEGVSEFKALLFLPKEAPFNLFMPDFQKKGLQLYVKRVFITDSCKELLPDYLRFVSGVVDSSDLPLNVSREILQDNPIIARIAKTVVSKILGELSKLLENSRDAYEKFFAEFGKILKEGVYSDFTNAEKLKDLVMYQTLNSDGKLRTLSEYVTAMPENQKDIYYLSGSSLEAVKSNPTLEYFRKQGFDVIFMTDPIDDWIMQSMFQYQKKNFKSIAKGDFELPEEQDKLKEVEKKYEKLVKFFADELKDEVSQVRFSVRLTDSPCCLITEGQAMAPHIERLFRAMHQEVPVSKRIMELNSDNALIQALFDKVDSGADDADLKSYVRALYDQALLAEGSPIPDPVAFATTMNKLMLAVVKK